MNKDSILFDRIKGERIEKIIDKLLYQPQFGLRFDSPFIYSKETIDKMALYYYNCFVCPVKNKMEKFPEIERKNKEDTFYEEVPLSMMAGMSSIKAGDLIRDLMLKKGVRSTPEYYEILPMLMEKFAYEDLSVRTKEKNIKFQGMAYQINRAVSATKKLDVITELDKKYDYQIQREAMHCRMIIIATSIVSAFDIGEVNEEFSKDIRKIIAGQKTIDDMIDEYNLSYNDCKNEVAISNEIQMLKMKSPYFYM